MTQSELIVVGIIWPAWMTEKFGGLTVVENLASIGHFLFALALALVSLECARRVFWAYTIYQAITTLGKLALYPGVELAQWPDDLLGDIAEYLLGMGLAYALGPGVLRPSWWREEYCSRRSVDKFLGLLIAVWLVALAYSLTG